MKFAPLAGIETNLATLFTLEFSMKFAPLAGIETQGLKINWNLNLNEIHTPCGDWNSFPFLLVAFVTNEIHTPCGDWNTGSHPAPCHDADEIRTPCGDWNYKLQFLHIKHHTIKFAPLTGIETESDSVYLQMFPWWNSHPLRGLKLFWLFMLCQFVIMQFSPNEACIFRHQKKTRLLLTGNWSSSFSISYVRWFPPL